MKLLLNQRHRGKKGNGKKKTYILFVNFTAQNFVKLYIGQENTYQGLKVSSNAFIKIRYEIYV